MKFICGGQTGVDRAVLDACLKHDFPCGGWCPKGRLAEDGQIPTKYPLIEIESTSYDDRTETNVLESDATIIIFEDEIMGGTLLSKEVLIREDISYLEIDLSSSSESENLKKILAFIENKNIINVSGLRESEAPDIAERVVSLFEKVIKSYRSIRR